MTSLCYAVASFSRTSLATRSPAAENHREVQRVTIPQLALEELKPTTQNQLALLAGWTPHPRVDTPPCSVAASTPANAVERRGFGQSSSSSSPAHRTCTSSLMVCTLYEIIFGGLNKDSPPLNRQRSRVYPNITVYSCPVV